MVGSKVVICRGDLVRPVTVAQETDRHYFVMYISFLVFLKTACQDVIQFQMACLTPARRLRAKQKFVDLPQHHVDTSVYCRACCLHLGSRIWTLYSYTILLWFPIPYSSQLAFSVCRAKLITFKIQCVDILSIGLWLCVSSWNDDTCTGIPLQFSAMRHMTTFRMSDICSRGAMHS